jgi:predicted nuclease with RNAse H fold
LEDKSRFPKKTRIKADTETRSLTEHEIEAVTAILAAVLHLQGQTEFISDGKEGYTVIPKKRNWKTLI